MRQQRLVIPSVLVLLALVLPASSSAQQSSSNFALGLMGGFGGSFDAEPDTEFDNFGFQAYFSMATDIKAQFAVRAGQMSFESEDSIVEADLNYVTLAGEYSFTDSNYNSRLFLGLGFYDVGADRGIADDSGLGLTVGTAGDFRLTDRLSFLVEFSGHMMDLDYAQFFVMAHAGVAYNF